MDTKKLYREDPFLESGIFHIEEIILSEEECKNFGLKYIEGTALIVLEKTVFYPEGGGQPCDTGMLGGLPVIEAFETKSGGDAVFHRLKLPEDGILPALFRKGAAVEGKIDWDRRFLNMQMHCAEHVLSGLFLSMYGGENKGFHMGADYFTLDIDFTGEFKVSDISKKHIDAVERAANRIVWKDVPVTTKYFSSREDTASLPLRKQLGVDEDISVVFVGDSKMPDDCVACCGIHPDSTGKIGLISIVKSENYKGMLRLTAKAGSAALEDAMEKRDIVNELSSMYSSEQKTLIGRINLQEEKSREVRNELRQLKRRLLEQEGEDIRRSLEAKFPEIKKAAAGDAAGGEAGERGVFMYVHRFDDIYSIEDINDMAKRFDAPCGVLFAFVGDEESTAILRSSGEPECGKLVKEKAPSFGGRGGGNKELARAVFEDSSGLQEFLKAVEESL